jgi:glycosyltransferase involved in cell wall biosynthesis
MAMGLPLLLALPDGEAAAILRGHEAGWWVPPADPVALAALARRLADDPAERQRRAAASLAAAPLHSRRRQAEEMIQLLEIAAAGYGDRAGADGTAP